MNPVILRRPKEDREWWGCVVSAWDVFDRVTDRLIGAVVLDDVEPDEIGAARHLWHAYLEGDREACGTRSMTRAEAVDDLLAEDAWARANPPDSTPDPPTTQWGRASEPKP